MFARAVFCFHLDFFDIIMRMIYLFVAKMFKIAKSSDREIALDFSLRI